MWIFCNQHVYIHESIYSIDNKYDELDRPTSKIDLVGILFDNNDQNSD